MRGLVRVVSASLATLILPAMVSSQSPDIQAPVVVDTMSGVVLRPTALTDTTKTFLTRRDLLYAGEAVATTAIVSAFDARIARWTQQASLQGSSSRHRVIQDVSNVTGETVLTWATVVGYGVGRLTHASTLADVSLHLIEAQALTSVAGQTVRGILGRARPSVDPNKQYSFHWGQGFTHFAYRAFPSLHSAAGFIVASGVLEEMRERNSEAIPYVAPFLYALALAPGVTRMYLNQHWASDVVAGAFLGQFVGTRVVHYAHTHHRNKLDRALLGMSVTPSVTPSGTMMVMVSIER